MRGHPVLSLFVTLTLLYSVCCTLLVKCIFDAFHLLDKKVVLLA